MIARMLSGLLAGGDGRALKSLSEYRMVLAAAVWGLWSGWLRWVAFGGETGDGFGTYFGLFSARWLLSAWLVTVAFWKLFQSAYKDCLIAPAIIVGLRDVGTTIQARPAIQPRGPTSARIAAPR